MFKLNSHIVDISVTKFKNLYIYFTFHGTRKFSNKCQFKIAQLYVMLRWVEWRHSTTWLYYSLYGIICSNFYELFSEPQRFEIGTRWKINLSYRVELIYSIYGIIFFCSHILWGLNKGEKLWGMEDVSQRMSELGRGMDGRTDGRTDGRKEGREGRTEG